MNVSQRFHSWRRREAEKLRGMTLREKAGYLITYYKGWFAGFLILLLFLGYAGDVIIQRHRETVLQGFFTNDDYNLFPTGQLQKDVSRYLGLQRGQQVAFDDDLYVDLHGEATQYTAASNGKIIAYMAAKELDFVVTSREVYDHFVGEIPLRDLSELLPPGLYRRLTPYLASAPNHEGKLIPCGIELSASRFLRDTGLEEGSYYLFVPHSAPHSEQLCAFIQYCFE